MLYAVGLNNDKTLRQFVDLAPAGEVTLVDLHALFRTGWRFSVPAESGPSGALEPLGWLDPRAGYYVRVVDLSPVLEEPERSDWRAMLLGITSFLETVSGPVANRPGAHVHNGSKPLHEAWLAARGFDVPPAVTTADPNRIRAFLERHGCAIVKTLCGVRGTAQLVTVRDFDGFVPEQGPVHLQKVVQGYDVRVHMVGDTAHAEKIVADGVDYRERSVDSRHDLMKAPDALVRRMARASREMGLAFTGWDFKVDADGRFWCLEVNPMPGYDSYDRRADGAISRSLLRYLRHAPLH